MKKLFIILSYMYAALIGFYVCKHFVYHDTVPTMRWFINIFAFIFFFIQSKRIQ